MRRSVIAFFGGLAVALLIWILAVSMSGVQSGEAIASLPVEETSVPTMLPVSLPADAGTEVVLTPQPLPDTGMEVVPTPQPLVDVEEQLFIELYERVSPSVVHIRVTTRGSGGTGSGFVWDTEGHIVTNNHVVESARRIMVSFADDTTAEAELVGADPDTMRWTTPHEQVTGRPRDYAWIGMSRNYGTLAQVIEEAVRQGYLRRTERF